MASRTALPINYQEQAKSMLTVVSETVYGDDGDDGDMMEGIEYHPVAAVIDSAVRDNHMRHEEIITRILRALSPSYASYAPTTKTFAYMFINNEPAYTYAVSGWGANRSDGAIDRPTALKRVFALTKYLGHRLPNYEHDERQSTDKPNSDGRYNDRKNDGSYYACHCEKQLLASLIFDGVSEAASCSSPGTLPPPITLSAAQSLQGLKVELFVVRPSSLDLICYDCKAFCKKFVNHFKIELCIYGCAQATRFGSSGDDDGWMWDEVDLGP